MSEPRKIDKLNGTNYATWSYQMKMVMMECELWSVIEPGENEPVEDADANEKRKYILRQGKACAKIALSLCDEQQMHIRQLTTAKEIWEELERLYAPRDSKFRIVQLRRTLYSQKLDDFNSVELYLAQVNKTVTELANIGDVIDDGDLAMTILCGLSDDWDTVVTALCNLPDDEFKCTTVKRRLLAEDARRHENSELRQAAMSVKKNDNSSNEKGKQRREQMNDRNEDKSNKTKGKEKFTCYYCGKPGHFSRNCIKKAKDKNKQCFSKTMSASAFCGSTISSRNVWIIDSGATHHMTPNKEYFATVNKSSEKVMTIDGTTRLAAGKGMVRANIVESGSEYEKLEMKNTLLVPAINYGILSIRQLIENDKKVIFDKSGCRIYDNDQNLIIQAENEGRLYVVKMEPELNVEVVNSVKSGKEKLGSLRLWHRRFMHVNQHQIVKMVSTQSAIGLNCEVTAPTTCDSCLTGKSTRQPFTTHPSADTKNEGKILNLVHADLMGPIDVKSFGGNKYILGIVDDASRYIFIKLLKSKGEVLSVFKEWKNQAEKQTDMKLKRIRTDNGLEFCSKNWDNFCKNNGIIHETTMVYTPQQNGVAERSNRTLMDLVRCVTSNGQLPKAAWGELVFTAAYIRNRVTNSHNNIKTPYELWVGRKPSVRHLRAIGCKVFAHIPKEKRSSKLSSRAKQGLLVGYARHGRGYRVWIPGTHQIMESRDCVFKEEEIELRKITPQETDKKEAIVMYQDEESDTRYNIETKPTADSENSSQSTSEIEENFSNLDESEEEVQHEPQMKKRGRPKGSKENKDPRTHGMTLRNKNPMNSNDNVQTNMTKAEDNEDPTSFTGALNSTDAANWMEAMNEEMESLRRHKTWTLVEAPPDATIIKCKWVFKRKSIGETQRFKARLVAKGFTQKKGVDYDEIYAPVSSFETLRLLIAVGVEEKWLMDQFDVKSAYLHSDLKETLYMDQPEGFIRKGEENLVCKLQKSIYGLKQSGRCWNDHFSIKLEKMGFVRNQINPCVYEMRKKEGRAILAVYVDDILALTENQTMRREVKRLLGESFDIKHLGKISHMLGVKFTEREDGSITLSQEEYVNKLLKRFGLYDVKGIKTPMEVKPQFLEDEKEMKGEELSYRELIGGLLNLSCKTRPDISFSVAKLA